MFYVIALAGAHKRVINQLREQLEMVSTPEKLCSLVASNLMHKASEFYFLGIQGSFQGNIQYIHKQNELSVK